MRAVVGNRVLGVLFVMSLVAGVWVTYALFTKKFTDYTRVTLRADKAGLQLPFRADVKLRGIFVGEVLDVSAEGDQVEVELGLYPEETGDIPRNVQAALVPKTLFGEKFVELRLPDAPGGRIAAGDTIDQVALPPEVEDVLNSLYPLLRTVQPAEINYTLTALADALEGRGDRLGANLETLDGYLTRLNPDVSALVEDLRLLGQTSDVYASVLPEAGRLLRNSVTTTGTVEDTEQQVQALFSDVGSLSGTTQTFLENNGDNLVELSELAARQTRVLATYAPLYPCFTSSIVTFYSEYGGNWRGNALHINLELIPKQPRGYTPEDQARYAEKDRPSLSVCTESRAGTYNQGNLPPPDRFAPDLDDGAGPISKRSGTAWTDERSSVSATPTDDRHDLADLLLGPVPDLEGVNR